MVEFQRIPGNKIAHLAAQMSRFCPGRVETCRMVDVIIDTSKLAEQKTHHNHSHEALHFFESNSFRSHVLAYVVLENILDLLIHTSFDV